MENNEVGELTLINGDVQLQLPRLILVKETTNGKEQVHVVMGSSWRHWFELMLSLKKTKQNSLISPLRSFLDIWSKKKYLHLSLLFPVMSFLTELPIRLYVYSLSPYQNISSMTVYSLLYSKWQQCLANECFK